jgi:hypothetical protein
MKEQEQMKHKKYKVIKREKAYAKLPKGHCCPHTIHLPSDMYESIQLMQDPKENVVCVVLVESKERETKVSASG